MSLFSTGVGQPLSTLCTDGLKRHIFLFLQSNDVKVTDGDSKSVTNMFNNFPLCRKSH